MYERNGSRARLRSSLTLHVTHCVHTSMNLRKNEIYFLNKSHRIGIVHQWLPRGGGG